MLALLLCVLHVGEVGIDRAANELGVNLLELLGFVAELADLSRTHEGEVERPEEQAHVLSCTY